MRITENKFIETISWRFINVEKLIEKANLELVFYLKFKTNCNLLFKLKIKPSSSLIFPLNLRIKKEDNALYTFETISLAFAVYIFVVSYVRLMQFNLIYKMNYA
jgi:hypothetical protein